MSASSAKPVIRFEAFSCGYDPKGPPILRDIDLEIPAGQFVLLLGASGSGTTTLGLCLNGIIPHVQGWTEGSVSVAGLTVSSSRVAELATHVGMVFQDVDSQLTNLYVRDEVTFGPENLALDREEVVRRARHALEFVDALEFEGKFVFELSGGQKQKVVIASVLAMESEIIFLDEPTANLDPRSSSDVFRFLRELKEQGKTLLITEYKMDELVSLADRMIVLGNGRVIYDGAPREIVSRHGTELQERWGLWVPQAAELELLLRERRKLEASLFPLHASEAIQIYSGYSFGNRANGPRESSGGTGSGETLIRAEDVDYRYADGTEALWDVTMEVRSGEVLALVGPNGSGKTTLSKLFVGLYRPTRGRVTAFGKPTTEVSTRELTRRIGYVFQYPEHQFVKDSVEEEVRFSLQVLGVEEAESRERVQEVLHIFGLEGLEERHPYSLSGGEKRRLSVATMVITRPAVLLMDEPTYGQDRRNTERMMNAVFEATGGGRTNSKSTIILVTHDMKLVATYATRTVAMHRGTIAFDGPPNGLFADQELLQRVNLEDPPLFQIVRGLRAMQPEMPEFIVSPLDFIESVIG